MSSSPAVPPVFRLSLSARAECGADVAGIVCKMLQVFFPRNLLFSSVNLIWFACRTNCSAGMFAVIK